MNHQKNFEKMNMMKTQFMENVDVDLMEKNVVL